MSRALGAGTANSPISNLAVKLKLSPPPDPVKLIKISKLAHPAPQSNVPDAENGPKGPPGVVLESSAAPKAPPPRWADEHPTRPCPECGQSARILHPRIEHLRMIGRRLFAVADYVSHS